MALEIRNIPVLTGSAAESFIRAAEEREKNPRRLGIKVSFAQIDEMAARARSYREAHNGKNPFSIWFYQKNGFRFLYPDENLEKEAFHIDVNQSLNTRMMYLDLIDFVS